MQEISDELKRDNKTIGFVPTMGYIHEGHLSLVDISKRNTDITIASLFVNPIQFGPREDYKEYPRDIDKDKRLLGRRGCSILFYPDVDDMYGKFFRTEVFVRDLSKRLCGMTRRAHFKGVTTVVAKLFNIIKPNITVFGQKDAQQAIIIKRMVEDLNYNMEIITGPIIREKDGLAKSSRNVYLSKNERKDAIVIYSSLKEAEQMIEKGERKVSRILRRMRKIISSNKNVRIDYIKAVETNELKPISEIRGEVLIAIACHFRKVRLIDNIIVKM